VAVSNIAVIVFTESSDHHPNLRTHKLSDQRLIQTTVTDEREGQIHDLTHEVRAFIEFDGGEELRLDIDITLRPATVQTGITDLACMAEGHVFQIVGSAWVDADRLPGIVKCATFFASAPDEAIPFWIESPEHAEGVFSTESCDLFHLVFPPEDMKRRSSGRNSSPCHVVP
jgi:hypothetical protein